MTWHPDQSQLHDHLEGLLPREEEERVRGHLETCSACRDELRELTELLDGLGSLSLEARPSRDLWPHIRWRIGGETPAEGRTEERRRLGRRFNLSAWQLLAASLVVAFLSGGLVWTLISGPDAPSGYEGAGIPSAAQPVGLSQVLSDYDDAVADLESVLEQGREVLDEETIQVLEENLAIIDGAIQEAQEALVLDPASGVLQRILTGNLRRKVDLLRQAAIAVYANS